MATRLHDFGKKINESRNPRPIAGVLLGSMFTAICGFIPIVGPLVGGYIGGSISSFGIRGSSFIGLFSGLFAGVVWGFLVHELAHLFDESTSLGIHFSGTVIYMGLFAMVGGALAGAVNEDEHVREKHSDKSGL